MKRFRVWGLSAALVVAGGAVARAESPPPSPSPQAEPGTLMGKLFGPKKPKQAGPTVRTGPVTVAAPLKPEVVADALRSEQDAWLRRISVCTELRRVALERGDDALARQADELERQATALYNARVAGLGAPKPKVPPSDIGVNSLMTLDAPGSPSARAKKLLAPAAPVPGTATADVREVKP